MPLPILPRPEYPVKNRFYPKGKLTLLPFTVAQEEVLIMVKDGSDKEKLNGLRQLIEGCVKDNIEVEKLPIFVIEELFLRLREKSIGEFLELQIRCDGKKTVLPEGNNGLEPAVEEDCTAKFPIQIDLAEAQIVTPEGHSNVIMLSEDIGVKLRYPTIDSFDEIDPSDSRQIFLHSIESVFQGEDVTPAEDAKPEEIEAFYKSMSFQNKRDVIEKFFAKQPHVHFKKSFKCPSCGKDHELEFNNVRDFFL